MACLSYRLPSSVYLPTFHSNSTGASRRAPAGPGVKLHTRPHSGAYSFLPVCVSTQFAQWAYEVQSFAYRTQFTDSFVRVLRAFAVFFTTSPGKRWPLYRNYGGRVARGIYPVSTARSSNDIAVSILPKKQYSALLFTRTEEGNAVRWSPSGNRSGPRRKFARSFRINFE